MVEDVLRSLGYLCLGSRMKRVGERLQADTQRMLDRLDVRVASGHYPILAALDRLGPLAIGELARALGVTQPGITRSVSQLAAAGLIDTSSASDDQRRKIVSLSPDGRRLVERAKRDVWPCIEAAVADLCGELSGPLLQQLAEMEDGLAAAPLDRRPNMRGGSKP